MRGHIFVVLALVILATVMLSGTAFANEMFTPPQGIVPTTAALSTVVNDVKIADGYAKPPSTRVEDGTVTAWGLKGSFHLVEQGADFTTTDFGVVSYQRGRLNGQPWSKNENGLVIQFHDEADFADTTGFVYTKRLDDGDVRLLGETPGPSAAYVLEVKLENGRLQWVFVDKHSRLITRIEVPYSDHRDTYIFSDFRKTGPYTDPWRMQASDGVDQNTREYITTSIRYNTDVTTSDLAIPDNNTNLVRFPSAITEVKLPAQIVSKQGSVHLVDVPNESHDITRPGDMSTTYAVAGAANPHLLVNASIDGQGVNFYLDSGAAGIFINSDVARKLGLKMFGPVARSGYGNWVPSYIAVPQLRVGDLTMNNVVAYSLPQVDVDELGGSSVIGLIGYDFLANNVFAIDYATGTVTAMNPFSFVPPATAIALPATMDEGVPFISVQIGQSSSARLILDTGSTNCFLSKPFAAAHSDDIKDQGGGVDVNRIWLPRFGFSAMSGPMTERATEVKQLTIAGITLNEWLMFRDLDDPGEGFHEDGIIGYDFLRHFTVYLDYPVGEIFLMPNGSGLERSPLTMLNGRDRRALQPARLL